MTVTFTPVFYMGPIIYAIFLTRMLRGEYRALGLIDKGADLWKINEQIGWLVLEIMLFFLNITSLMLFIATAYCRKYKSISKHSYDASFAGFKNYSEIRDEVVGTLTYDDIWNNKKSDDYLRYFKWEAFQYMNILTSMQLAISFNGLCEELSDDQTGQYIRWLYAMFVAKRIQNFMKVSATLKRGYVRNVTRKSWRNALSILFNIVMMTVPIILAFMDGLFKQRAPIIRFHVWYEIITQIVEPLYMLVILIQLNKA